MVLGAPSARPGKVPLAGAGPGDPDLLTVKALNVLRRADVVVHDGLVSEAILDLAPAGARRIAVAKRKSRHAFPQADINRLLVAAARAGKRVVRLKGGDPFVFGRGGEELEVLREHGIDFEVVPGITAAIACGAYAGIPLTHREHAQSVRFVTAHTKDDDGIDWATLAQDRQTLAFYMGVSGLERIRDRLIGHGRAPDTPM